MSWMMIGVQQLLEARYRNKLVRAMSLLQFFMSLSRHNYAHESRARALTAIYLRVFLMTTKNSVSN